MNKKNIIIISIAILIIVIAILTVVFKSNFKSNNVETNNTNENYNSKSVSDKEESNYQSSLLELYHNFDEDNVNGNIVDMVGNSTDNNYIVTKDNKIYRNALGKFKYIFTADKNFKRILTNTISGNLLIENKDSSYSLYSINDTNIKYTFNAENLVMAYISGAQPTIYILENNYLYMKNTEKLPVYIDESNARLSSNPVYFNGKIKYANPSLTSLAIIKDNGDTYYASMNGGWPLTEKNAYAIGTNSNYGLINNVEKIYANGSSTYYKHPFYSKISDANNLYVREGGLTSTTTYTIALPTGYTTGDIKDLHAVEEIIMVMNDGNVYYMEDAKETSSWTLVEELTNLNKDNHIISIVETNTQMLILCDDNNLYELDY